MKKPGVVLCLFLSLPCFAERGGFGLPGIEFFAGLPYSYENLDHDGTETLVSALPSFSFGLGVLHYGIAGKEGLGLFALSALDFPEKTTHSLGGTTSVFRRADTTIIEAAAGAAYRFFNGGAFRLPVLAGPHFFYFSGNSLMSQTAMLDLTKYGFGLFVSAAAEFHVNKTLYFFCRVQCALDFVVNTERIRYAGVNVAGNIAYFIEGKEFLALAPHISVMPVIGTGIKLDGFFD